MLRSAGLARLSVCCIGALKAQAKMSLAAVTKTPLFLATVGRPRQRDALSPTEAQSYATRIPSFLQDTQRFSVRLPRVAMLGGERTFTNAAGDGDPGADFDPDAARKMLVEEGGLLIDVRTAEEFAGGAVQGSVNISHDFLPSRFGEVEELTKGNTSKPIVVYCRSGTRSQYAKEFLISKGYSYVSNLGGAAQAQVLTDLMLDESSK